MIKTYKARVNNNNISYLLLGKHGNQMRYNFTNGNVVTNKYPSITLRNRYAQDLLESSLLFANNTIVLDHEEEEYPGEKAKLEEEKKAALEPKVEPENVDEPANDSDPKSPKVVDGIEIVEEVHTADEAVTYVNQRWNKKFILPIKAIEFATKENVHFPNCNQV